MGNPHGSAPSIDPNDPTLSASLPRAALYHRVSTDEQDPTLARDELRAVARARGYRVTLDVEEVASGVDRDRPGLARVMSAAQRGQIEAVFVWKLDRFGRSTVDLLRHVETLKLAKVRFVATSQGLDTGGDAAGALLLTILSGVAEFERATLRERIALGIRKARASGKHLGRPRATGAGEGEVQALRAAGLSWGATAAKLGVTVAMARRRASEAAPAP